VLEQVMASIETVQTRYAELTKSPDYLESILAQGADRAREIAAHTLKRVKNAMGFVV
jgi:tryptophanyl-tRNA synthetase